jgi:hypothetical protein
MQTIEDAAGFWAIVLLCIMVAAWSDILASSP